MPVRKLTETQRSLIDFLNMLVADKETVILHDTLERLGPHSSFAKLYGYTLLFMELTNG